MIKTNVYNIFGVSMKKLINYFFNFLILPMNKKNHMRKCLRAIFTGICRSYSEKI